MIYFSFVPDNQIDGDWLCKPGDVENLEVGQLGDLKDMANIGFE
jgi:hypothetical protein